MPTATADRFWSKVDQSGDCWLWTAGLSEFGYGRFGLNGGAVYAHRWAYEQMVGPIPEGLQIDHLCRNRACVNPDHLEPVTQAENMRRGIGGGHLNRAKTHCPKGHPFDEQNTYIYRNRRACRICRLDNCRSFRTRRRTPSESR